MNQNHSKASIYSIFGFLVLMAMGAGFELLQTYGSIGRGLIAVEMVGAPVWVVLFILIRKGMKLALWMKMLLLLSGFPLLFCACYDGLIFVLRSFRAFHPW